MAPFEANLGIARRVGNAYSETLHGRTPGNTIMPADGTSGGAVLLHVTECPIGGVSRAIELAIKALPHLSHVVLAPAETIRTDELGASFIRLPDGFTARVKEVRRVAAERRVTAVQAHSSWAGVYTRLAGLSVPVLYQPHCYAFSDTTRPHIARAAYWLAERALTRRTAAVLALTPHEERQARRLGIRTVFQIKNAPTITTLPERATVGERSTLRTVTMVGRIAPQKDPCFFAEVARQFREDPTMRFMWIGDVSSGRDMYKEGLRALRNANVEITGWLDDDELKARLAEADIYLHSAAYEGFPLSLLDACSLGIPSIVRDIPSLADCGLPRFATPTEAAVLVESLLRDDGALAECSRTATALSDGMSIRSHNASIAVAYAHYGMEVVK